MPTYKPRATKVAEYLDSPSYKLIDGWDAYADTQRKHAVILEDGLKLAKNWIDILPEPDKLVAVESLIEVIQTHIKNLYTLMEKLQDQ